MSTQVVEPQHDEVMAVLSRCVSRITARTVYDWARRNCGADANSSGLPSGALLASLTQGVSMFCPDPSGVRTCVEALERLFAGFAGEEREESLTYRLIAIDGDAGVVEARRTARTFAARLGFDATDQSRITTAVSELSRNIHLYAQRGTVEIRVVESPKTGISVVAKDNGPGIANLETILGGRYRSKTGLGLGIVGCKKLMDEFEIESAPGKGTFVKITKYLGNSPCYSRTSPRQAAR